MIKQYDKYKKSGIEWVGDVPNHWRKLKIGRSFNKIGSGTTPKSGSDNYYEDGSINWCTHQIEQGCQWRFKKAM